MNSKRPLGVTIFGAILIISSLGHMVTLLDFNHYVYLFQPLPGKIILLRYFISWALRIIGLISGIGILYLKNTFRKLALYLFLVTIVTVSWKHPYVGFQRHAAYLDQIFSYQMQLKGVVLPSFSSIAGIATMGARILDVLFAGIFIYYFTRLKVKGQFNVAIIPAENYGLLENFLAKKRARMADRLIPHQLRDGRILDIGCGTTPFFLNNTKFKYKYGIEITIKDCLSKENIVLEKFDLEKDKQLPFEDNFFNVVTMLAVFEHIKPDKLPGVLKEIKRVLKPGGRLVMTTPCPWAEKLLWLMAKLRLIDSWKMEEHKGAYQRADIVHYFDKASFEKEKVHFGYFELCMNSWVYAEK